MRGPIRFTLEFAPKVVKHLAVIERKEHRPMRKMEQQVMSSVEFWTAVSERTGDGPKSEVSAGGSG